MSPEFLISQIDPASEVLLTSAQLRRRWGGCSDMLLWRRLKADAAMPLPLRMCGRRYWRLSEIVAYERGLERKGVDRVAAA
jgi:hypothetical protein